MELTPADLARLPQDWTRAEFYEMLDRIRTARAVGYYRAMRPRKPRDLSQFITTTNLPKVEIYDEQRDRRARSR